MGIGHGRKNPTPPRPPAPQVNCKSKNRVFRVGREDIHWIGPFCQDDLEDHFDGPIDFLHRPRKGLCQGIKLLSHDTNLVFFTEEA